LIELGATVYLFPWLGDRAVNALAALLRRKDILTEVYNGLIEVKYFSREQLLRSVKSILIEPKPTAEQLAEDVEDTIAEKHDRVVPEQLRRLDYGVKFFDLDAAWNWLIKLASEYEKKPIMTATTRLKEPKPRNPSPPPD
jgi:ATP-dependent Lhr-like helicase